MFLAALLKGNFTERAGKGGDSSPDWTLAWGKGNSSLPSLPTGYFLADGTDLLWNQTLGQAWDLVCHHALVRLGKRRDREGGMPSLGVPGLSSAFCPVTSPRVSNPCWHLILPTLG